jgi:hypothetical protein
LERKSENAKIYTIKGCIAYGDMMFFVSLKMTLLPLVASDAMLASMCRKAHINCEALKNVINIGEVWIFRTSPSLLLFFN